MTAVVSPGQLPDEAKAELLRTGVVTNAEPVGKGVTATWRVTLEGNGITHDASFQSVDEREPVKDLGGGEKELHFVDSYRYNIAAYRLAKLLGLGNMVPVSVERAWRGERGAMTWWVDDVVMDEAEMHERGLQPPDPVEWSRQSDRVRVFNELVYDTDRNQGNLLLTSEWQIWMIDFTRAFRRWPRIRRPEWLVRCDRDLLAALRSLTRAQIDSELGKLVGEPERDGLWARRQLILDHFDRLIAERGADQVLY